MMTRTVTDLATGEVSTVEIPEEEAAEIRASLAQPQTDDDEADSNG